MTKSLYLKCERGDIGEFVLLTGDPARVDRIAARLTLARTMAHNREFYTVTGEHRGQRVSVVSSGIGAPSAAIALEELHQLGARAVVRLGTIMGVGAPLGAFTLSTGAARFEGTSPAYLPLTYPAVPNWPLAVAIYTASQRAGLDMRAGITVTYDAFYPQMAPALVGRGLPDMNQLREADVQGLDMETALLYILGMRLKLAVAAACVVTNNADPFAVMDAAEQHQAENRLVDVVLEALLEWKEKHGNAAD